MKKLDVVLLSIGIAIAVPLGQALLTLNDTTFDHPMPWLRALAIGVSVGLGSQIYKWGLANGPVVTISRRAPAEPEPMPNVTYTTSPSASTIYPLPTREVAASPVVLPEGWAANQPQAPEATSVSPPV